MKYPGNRSNVFKIAIGVGALLVLVLALTWQSNGPLMMRRISTGSGSSGAASPGAMMKSFSSVTSEESAVTSPRDSDTATLGDTAAEVDQKIIKTGSIGMTADDVDDTIDAVAAAAIAANGFVQSSSIDEDQVGNRYGSIVVRTPADAFEATVDAIKALGVRVESESTQGQDVTEAYTDLEARLRAAQAQETQYLLILEDATTVGEVLAVHEHLAQVRSTIESLQGQVNYLENLTSYSTISVSVTQETRITLPEEKFDIVREVKLAGQYVVVLAQRTLTGVIWLLIVGGSTVLPLVLLGWIVWRLVKRFRK